ncbi:serine/threonine protein phosphatase [Hyphomonas sp. WL0036]|uniref:metallophosphoesterase family protein n=1 Tax=Hyphomonas sediminis TaxID=2866160 RepID=UPI001C8027BB|nr:metallophosphoesterase family protein [Hyphomonas sediminis]MBY9068486.1 serine/threonine protein phosphatase [Hyphomonas sediminis]
MALTRGKLADALRTRFGQFTRSADAARRSLLSGFRVLQAGEEAASEPVEAEPPRITEAPEGVCLYAVGDIHGRMDLLTRLVEIIDADAAQLPEGVKPQIIFLGDYIDRGLQSRDVLEYFSSGALDRYDPVFLLGNHEEALLRFLKEVGFGMQWTRFGGAETLYSYGFAPPNARASLNSHDDMAKVRDAWAKLWENFRERLPESHLKFLQALKPYHVAGDYLFVHAGLRPGLSLDEQSQRDMLWIRDEFLEDGARFDHLVVHGHTPEDAIHRDNRRIGLDTGAFLTGRLSAARLFGTDVAFLNT